MKNDIVLSVSRQTMPDAQDCFNDKTMPGCLALKEEEAYLELETIVTHFLLAIERKDEYVFHIACVKLTEFLSKKELLSLCSSLKLILEPDELDWIHDKLIEGISND